MEKISNKPQMLHLIHTYHVRSNLFVICYGIVEILDFYEISLGAVVLLLFDDGCLLALLNTNDIIINEPTLSTNL